MTIENGWRSSAVTSAVTPPCHDRPILPSLGVRIRRDRTMIRDHLLRGSLSPADAVAKCVGNDRATLDVVVGVHGRLGLRRHVERLGRSRSHLRPLLLLVDVARNPPRRADTFRLHNEILGSSFTTLSPPASL